MSEESNLESMKKTSAVPLRKETVRVTLKATPEPTSTAPIAPPAPTGMGIPAPAITAPQTSNLAQPSTFSAPPTPLATGPLATASLSTNSSIPAPPSVSLGVNTGSTTPEPAPTIQLNRPSALAGAGAPLVLSGAPTQPLPRATTAQPIPSASTSTESGTQTQAFDYADEESSSGEGFVTVLSFVALIIALVALVFQLMTSNLWLEGDWARLLG